MSPNLLGPFEYLIEGNAFPFWIKLRKNARFTLGYAEPFSRGIRGFIVTIDRMTFDVYGVQVVYKVLNESMAHFRNFFKKVATEPLATSLMHEGAKIPFFGQERILRLGMPQSGLFSDKEQGAQMYLTVPSNASEEVIRQAFRETSRTILKDYIRFNLDVFCERFNIQRVDDFRVQSMNSWGRCVCYRRMNTYELKHITYALRLAHVPCHLIDYVLIHELAHIKHMDHSKQFWSYVESMCPYYKDAEDELRHYETRRWPLD